MLIIVSFSFVSILNFIQCQFKGIILPIASKILLKISITYMIKYSCVMLNMSEIIKHN